VKRQLNRLIKQGKIIPKKPNKEITVVEADWTEEIKNKSIQLRQDELRDNKYICSYLAKEYNWDISKEALEYWFVKFKCHSPKKEEWLSRFLPKDKVLKLLSEKLTRIDIQKYLQKEYDVHISNDLIGAYIRKLN